MTKLIIWQNGVSQEVLFDAPAKLDDILKKNNVSHRHPCGGRGVCGKCSVTLSGCVSEPDPMEQQAGVRLSCRANLLGDAVVWLPDEQMVEQIETSGTESFDQGEVFTSMEGILGAAIDIGTTTLALKLYDLSTGTLLGQSSMENPQRRIAADVMGRIQASLEGEAEILKRQILKALDELLVRACAEAGCVQADVDAMVVVGNTTMLYLLTGENPQSLAYAPFWADDLFDRIDTILGRRTYLPPCMNAFVGADITAAVLASKMCEQNETALLCDIGTNGELALWNDGILYVSSTAAGPAFEGSGISCGCGSIRGAVDKVWIEDGEIRIHTIGGAEPLGVCGSGLLDAIAAYFDLEKIDETGAMEEDELVLGGEVKLLPRDVRAVQLAKAAIAAGIETLLMEAGIQATDVRKLYIAGGFGRHLNIESAVKIGLIPEELKDRVEVLGNAALVGAVYMLLNRNSHEKARMIAMDSSHVNLGGNKVFNELFIEKMMFE